MIRLAVLSSLFIAAPAFAFVPYKAGETALHWPSDATDLGLTLVRKDSPLSLSAFRDLVDTAFSQWSAAGNAVPEGRVRAMIEEAKKDDTDGETHQVQFLASNWPYDPNALAVTVFSYKKSTGQLVDADIYINATGPCLSDADAHNTCYDLQAVLTHEAGHFLGLDHNSDEHDSVMFPSAAPGDVSKRELTSDDVAGVVATYGGQANEVAATSTTQAQTSAQSPAATSSNQDVTRQGCSATGVSSSWMLLALVSLLRMRRVAAMAALSLCVGSQAFASSVARESIGQQMNRSDAVFVARSVASRSYFDQNLGFVVTEHTLAVDECVRGTCEATVTFRTLGGEVGDLMTKVSGEAEPTLHLQTLFIASKRKLGSATVFESTAFGQGVLGIDRDLGIFRTKTQWLRLEELTR